MNFSDCKWVRFTAAVFFSTALALVAAPGDEKPVADPWNALVDADAGRALREADERLAQKDWPRALLIVQKLLDNQEDVLTPLADDRGKVGGYVNVRTECERRLASLPEAGRRKYQRLYGPRAAKMLDFARSEPDDSLLSQIVKRYLYTPAGLEALQESARRCYTVDNYHLAALHYAHLLEHLGPARWTNDDLYRAILCLHRHGDVERMNRLQEHLLARAEGKLLRLEARNLKLAELIEQTSLRASKPLPSPWPIYRGDAARSNRGDGSAPILRPIWRRSMFIGNEYSERLKSLYRTAEENILREREPIGRGRPAILTPGGREEKPSYNTIVSGFTPIAVPVEDAKGHRFSQLVYRTHNGIEAVRARGGELDWQCLLSVRPPDIFLGWRWLAFHSLRTPRVLFENSALGSLSSDGQMVYAIDDFVVGPPLPVVESGPMELGSLGSNRPQKRPDTLTASNTLCAVTLEQNSGKLLWIVGDDEKSPLYNSTFLAPPLPLDGLLYVLVQKKKQIYLLCLDPKATRTIKAGRGPDSKIVFFKPLVSIGVSREEDPMRGRQAAHLAYGEGILVCPTNAGVVVGFDLKRRRLAWIYPYARRHDGRTTPTDSSNRYAWKTTAPAIAKGKVVFTAPDDSSIHCLNLSDGSLRWTRPKSKDDLYLGGVYEDKVPIVGVKSVRALSLASGESLWVCQAGLPSGQGVASGTVYYLPLRSGAKSRKPGIVAIDLRDGRAIAHHEARAKNPDGAIDEPGNLLFVEGHLISQSPWAIVRYPTLKDQLDDAKRGAERNPRDGGSDWHRDGIPSSQ